MSEAGRGRQPACLAAGRPAASLAQRAPPLDLALRGELENEVFSALALLITKLWTIYCFDGQKAFQNEYIGMIIVRYINTINHSSIVIVNVS